MMTFRVHGLVWARELPSFLPWRHIKVCYKQFAPLVFVRSDFALLS